MEFKKLLLILGIVTSNNTVLFSAQDFDVQELELRALLALDGYSDVKIDEIIAASHEQEGGSDEFETLSEDSSSGTDQPAPSFDEKGVSVINSEAAEIEMPRYLDDEDEDLELKKALEESLKITNFVSSSDFEKVLKASRESMPEQICGTVGGQKVNQEHPDIFQEIVLEQKGASCGRHALMNASNIIKNYLGMPKEVNIVDLDEDTIRWSPHIFQVLWEAQGQRYGDNFGANVMSPLLVLDADGNPAEGTFYEEELLRNPADIEHGITFIVDKITDFLIRNKGNKGAVPLIMNTGRMRTAHWFALVITQNEPGQRRYVVANSLGYSDNPAVVCNNDTLQNQTVLQLKRMIEAKMVNQQPHRYAQQIETLQGMGFDDVDSVVQALEQAEGDIERAVGHLLG